MTKALLGLMTVPADVRPPAILRVEPNWWSLQYAFRY